MPKTCLSEGCNNPVFSNKYCQRHQSSRTDSKWLKSLERRKEKQVIAKRTPINKVSKPQAKKNALYSAMLVVWKKENPWCAFPGCGRPMTDCHHSLGRVKYFLDSTTWVPLCREHHMFVETEGDLAKEMGLSGSRLENNHDTEEDLLRFIQGVDRTIKSARFRDDNHDGD